jgi:hypothetical protein
MALVVERTSTRVSQAQSPETPMAARTRSLPSLCLPKGLPCL